MQDGVEAEVLLEDLRDFKAAIVGISGNVPSETHLGDGCFELEITSVRIYFASLAITAYFLAATGEVQDHDGGVFSLSSNTRPAVKCFLIVFGQLGDGIRRPCGNPSIFHLRH